MHRAEFTNAAVQRSQIVTAGADCILGDVGEVEEIVSVLGYVLTAAGRRFAVQKVAGGRSEPECAIEIVLVTLARDVRAALQDEQMLDRIAQHTAMMLWHMKELRESGRLSATGWHALAMTLASVGFESDEQAEAADRVLRSSKAPSRRVATSLSY